ncbi:MAG: SRPBCC family protein [Streptosporangiaceae bacterium]
MNAPAGGLVLELQWVVNSPRDRIFSALTESAELARWWGPDGYTIAEIDLDVRVGGGYRFTMQPPGGQPFHLSGEFLEIEPPRRLVYTFRYEEPDPDDRQTVVALSLDEVGHATEVSLSHGEFATEARLELHRSGWRDSFEKLSELTESSA